MAWANFDTAPRDGEIVLACRNNGCNWEWAIVYFCKDATYPWQSADSDNAYADDVLDYWVALPPFPYKIEQ